MGFCVECALKGKKKNKREEKLVIGESYFTI